LLIGLTLVLRVELLKFVYGYPVYYNDKGERTAAVVPIIEYEDLLHQHHLTLELSDDYKKMIDQMLADEDAGNAEYVSVI